MDLINRYDAITIPVMPKEHREYQTMNLDDAYELGWFDCQKCIEELPSTEHHKLNIAEYIHDQYPDVWKHAEKELEVPSAERAGKWVNNIHDMPICNKCGYMTPYDRAIDDYEYGNFCPNCGADMRGERDETN